jgi:multimeric flavodoxin WrbA
MESDSQNTKKKKKILVVSASPRKTGLGTQLIQQVMSIIERQVDVDVDYLFLSDMEVITCQGCYGCLRKHEEKCPLRDDLDELRPLFWEADGFIVSSPTYDLSASSSWQSFAERAFSWLHRPLFFGKPVIVMSNAEIYGMEYVTAHLKEMTETMGMHVTGEIGVAGPGFFSDGKYNKKYRAKMIKKMEKAVSGFLDIFETAKKPEPTFEDLIRFNRWRFKTKLVHKKKMPHDYEYWKNNGWFESDYYYPSNVSKVKVFIAERLVRIVLGIYIRKGLVPPLEDDASPQADVTKNLQSEPQVLTFTP